MVWGNNTLEVENYKGSFFSVFDPLDEFEAHKNQTHDLHKCPGCSKHFARFSEMKEHKRLENVDDSHEDTDR